MNKVFFAQNVNNDPFINTCGYLYNWYAVNNPLFTPLYWRIPAQSHIEQLVTYLGGEYIAGGSLKEAGTKHWLTPNSGADNSSGFGALPCGQRLSNGSYNYLTMFNYLWTSTELNTYNAQHLSLLYNSAEAYQNPSGLSKNCGLTVRLMYNYQGIPPATLTDIDNNVYNVIQIGSQYWLAQNWRCSRLRDGTQIPLITDANTWSNLNTPAISAYNNNLKYV